MAKRLGDFLSQSARFTAWVGSSFVGSLRGNASMALLALALSTTLWMFVTTEQNPPRTGVFPIRIAVRAVNAAPDVEVLGPLETVLLRITAPTDQWADLSDRSFQAIVDVSNRRESEATLPVQVEATDSRVRILDVIPGDIRVQFDAAKSQRAPVKVNVLRAPPVGFSYEDPKIEPLMVTIHGPERLVSLVDTAVADVDLSAARSNVRQSFTLAARTSRGTDITGVRIEPANVQLDIAITRHIDYVSLAVVPDVRGNPAPGYWVSKVRVEPPVVAAAGPQDVLATLNSLRTQPFDVTNLTVTTARTVAVDLPQGLSTVDRSTVLVEVTIQPIQGTAVFNLAPRLVGAATGLFADLNISHIEVTVKGDGPALQDLTPDKIQVTLPIGGRGLGGFTVEPQVTVPAGIAVVRITPARVQITLTAASGAR